MLKKSLLIPMLLLALSNNLVQANNDIQLYSEAGYPYKNLINKAKAVKILFIENENNIACRVQVVWNTQNKTTEHLYVSKEQFEQAPLVNCLSRSDAKKLLAKLYQ